MAEKALFNACSYNARIEPYRNHVGRLDTLATVQLALAWRILALVPKSETLMGNRSVPIFISNIKFRGYETQKFTSEPYAALCTSDLLFTSFPVSEAQVMAEEATTLKQN